MPASSAVKPGPARTPGVDEVVVKRREPCAEDSLGSDLHPVIRRILRARGVGTTEELDYRLAALVRPDGLTGLQAAAERIADAVVNAQRTVIVGDFDADGATGTALCVLALEAMGHGAVDFVVPDRFRHGYGLGPTLAAEVAETHAPALLVTVDNGVSSVRGVEAANERGIDVVVTDHHLPGERLPAAIAIVNPNLPDATFPSKAAAGVGVAFYTMLAVRAELNERGWFQGRRPPNLAELTDLVALGTVADLVPLDRNNRILVSQGLRRIREGACRAGISALLSLAGRDAGRTTSTDLAFAVAPRLNAAGRLDDMSIGIRCLLAETEEEAGRLAAELHRLNQERRRIQSDMQAEAELMVDAEPDDDAILCATDDGWHAGVVGLVASRLKERWHRPAIAFAPDVANEGMLKGSARSIPGFNIRDAISWVDAHYPELLGPYGGHAMAAGLSLRADALPAFREALRHCAEATLPAQLLERVVWTDGSLRPEELNVALASQLRDWGPWGQAFPEPLFEGWFEILGRRALGDKHTKLTVRCADARVGSIDALLFNRPSDRVPEAKRLQLVYQLDLNEYMGRVSPQLVVRHVAGVA